MNYLLIFFALPIAVIIFSIIFQKILKCPIIVSAIIFAIFLVVTFVINNLNFLVATIAYTLLALITAYITMILCRINWNQNNCCRCSTNDNSCCECSTNDNNCENQSNISNLNENNFNGTYNIGRNGTTCTCNQIDNNTISVTANVCPNSNTNGRSGRFFGTYR